jgi:hypothetical protein
MGGWHMRSGLVRRCALAAPPLAILIALLVVPVVATNTASASGNGAAGATSVADANSAAGAISASDANAAGANIAAGANSAAASVSAVTSGSSSAAASAAASAGFVLPFTFNESPYAVVDLPPLLQPLSASTAAYVDTGLHDSQGVRMRRINGVLYNYPGAAASYGLANIDTYRDTGKQHYLLRAEAQAQRLIDIHVAAPAGDVDAWYYPNLYPRTRHDDPDEVIEPPWCSAMCQGLALALFSKLADTTGDQIWRDAADHTLASYLRPGPITGPTADDPFTVNVDSAGYLWLQEWPWTPVLTPDNTLNGHCFSAFGLYEYYELTHDTTALALFRGAMTTVEHYFPAFRNPGWKSHYCLYNLANNAKYHEIHVQLLLQIYTIMQDPTFARFADTLEGDYPKPAVSGSVHVGAGAYTAYRFAGKGVIVGRKTFTLTRSRSVPVGLRQRIRTRSIFFRAASGNLAGYWLKEVPGRVYLPGIVVPLIYSPARTAQLAPGSTYTAVRVSASGRVLASIAVSGGGTVLVGRGAVVNGYHSVSISDDALDGGALNGYWLTLGHGVTLQ